MQKSATKTIDAGLKYLAEKAPLNIRISGTCMMPLIEDGAIIQVSRKQAYFPGDILIKRTHNGQLIAHRLIGCYPRKGGLLYVTRADNAVSADGAVPGSQIIGRLCGGDCDPAACNIPLKTRLKSLGQFSLLVSRRIGLKLLSS